MDRPLSFLTDGRLDELLSAALRISKRRGGCYDWTHSWEGPELPRFVFCLLNEYRQRWEKKRERR